MNNTNKKLQEGSELRQALTAHKRIFWAVGFFSAIINLLYLAPSLYMLQVYDRVLVSRSEVTLLMLSLIILAVYALMGLIERVRSQVLVRLGNQLDLSLAPRVFDAVFERTLRDRQGGVAGAALSDMTMLRQFITGQGVFAFFDAPWAPIYIIVATLLHPWLGLMALGGMLIMVLLAWLNERVTRKPLEAANKASQIGGAFASSSLRNAEVISALGMLPALRNRWRAMQHDMLSQQTLASDQAGGVSAMTKFMRLTLQSSSLALGALLVLDNQLSPGMMIAANILVGRALAPIDQLIASWKPFSQARQAYQRLESLLEAHPPRTAGLQLPAPKGHLRLEQVVAVPPGGTASVLRGVSCVAEPGRILVVIGPSASGKSSLARVMTGIWQVRQGTARLDGAELFDWNKVELGQWAGYLPQDIELFGGSVAENIARFGPLDSEQIIAAANLAGVHEMILRLPQGYETQIGDAGSTLSGGQRQRIALARALYGNPRLLVLDEPNANLDDVGERALAGALLTMKQQGATVVAITHRQSLLAIADDMLVMNEGQVVVAGPRQQVLAALAKPTAAKQAQTPEAEKAS